MLLIRNGLREEDADAFLTELRLEFLQGALNGEQARRAFCAKQAKHLSTRHEGRVSSEKDSRKWRLILETVVLGVAGNAVFDLLKSTGPQLLDQLSSLVNEVSLSARAQSVPHESARALRYIAPTGNVTRKLYSGPTPSVLIANLSKIRDPVEIAHKIATAIPRLNEAKLRRQLSGHEPSTSERHDSWIDHVAGPGYVVLDWSLTDDEPRRILDLHLLELVLYGAG